MGFLKIQTVEKLKPLNKIDGVVLEIPIDEKVRPIVQPYRRVPAPLEKAVDKKIEELLALDVIEPVKGVSRWISPIVVVPKDNGKQVRICVDMRRANEAIRRENHPLPVIDDFLPHISGAKIFSKIYISNAFHQVEISESSREITTFITRKGLFRYKRLMFGISCAPEMFQKLIEQIISGCCGCANYIDDIVVYGRSKNEHDNRLHAVLKSLKDKSIALNEEKCVYGVPSIEFLGH